MTSKLLFNIPNPDFTHVFDCLRLSTSTKFIPRFCLRTSSTDHPVMDSLCGDKDCVEYSALACQKTLPCGHYCGGIADETTCLPCLHGCEAGVRLKQDADDMCMICFTEALSPVPSIQGSVQQSRLSSQFASQCCNLQQLLSTPKSLPFHLNLHFNLQF